MWMQSVQGDYRETEDRNFYVMLNLTTLVTSVVGSRLLL